MSRVFNVLDNYENHPRVHEWGVTFNFSDSGFASAFDSQILLASDLLLETAEIPGINNVTINTMLKGVQIAIPSRSNKSGTLPLVFKDTIDQAVQAYRIHKAFTDWMELIDGAENGVGYPNPKTRAQVTLTLYKVLDDQAVADGDFKKTPLFKIDMKKVYPTLVTGADLSSDNPTDLIKTNINLRYEWWERS